MKISALSQNIWNDNYYWKKRKPLIIALIKEFDPDIIGLQEVKGNSISDNQLTEIASKLKKYHFKFTLAKKDKDRVYGMGLISKGKIIKTKALKLRQDPNESEDNFPRILSHHMIEHKGKIIDILHTHLCFGSVGRKANIQQIVNYIDRCAKGKYTIFAGDFNAPPSDSSVKKLLTTTFDKRKFLDIGASSKNPRPTWPINKQLIDKNWNLKNPNKKRTWEIKPMRMDLILTLGKPKSLKYKLLYKKKIGLYHSDHYGVYTEIEFGN